MRKNPPSLWFNLFGAVEIVVTITMVASALAMSGVTGHSVFAAQEGAIQVNDSTPASTPGRIDAVCVHPGWASVSRKVRFVVPGEAHRVSVEITELPESLIGDSIQVEAPEGLSLREISLVHVPAQESWEAALAGLEPELEQAVNSITALEAERSPLVQQMELLDAIAQRIANTTAANAGTGKLDLDEITRLSEYLANERSKLAQPIADVESRLTEARRHLEEVTQRKRDHEEAGPTEERRARVTLNVDQTLADEREFEAILTYAVSGASWAPVHTLRASTATLDVVIETDILVGQQTGEDWHDVALSFSTANSENVEWESDFRPDRIGVRENNATRMAELDRIARLERPRWTPIDVWPAGIGIDSRSQSANESDVFTLVDRTGLPHVLEQLADRVHVPSGTGSADEGRGGSLEPGTLARFRLKSHTSRVRFRHVALPWLSQEALVVASLRNDTGTQLGPASASFYLDGKLWGRAVLPAFVPEAILNIAFGPDPDVLVHRREIERRNRKTGLLGDGRETQVDYRILIRNNSGSPVQLELWDQVPISRSDEVRITVVDESRPLSRDPYYVESQRPRGLLRWDLNVAGTHPSESKPTIDYTLVVSHHRDVEVDQIPK